MIGEEILGIKAEEVGTHSIRSGAAMSMYLGECPVYTITMIGRWSSDAFLLYIRKQVEQIETKKNILVDMKIKLETQQMN